jgi:RimJ/RimL family protein N-acetyltransferase
MSDDRRPATLDAAGWVTPEQASEYGKTALTGDLVRLRAAEPDDLDVLARWYRDGEFTVLQSETYQITSQAETVELMKKWFSNQNAHGGGNFVIEALTSGTVVGGVNIWGGRLPHRAGTLAIQIGGEFVGQGFGTDALGAAVGFAFRELGLNRLQLNVAAFNARAIRAYEKAGFVVEGRRREATFHNGRFCDELLMAILFDDWAAKN